MINKIHKVMKKILLVSTLLFAISCSHNDHIVGLDLDLEGRKVTNQHNRSVNVDVYDNRKDQSLLGSKTYSDKETITITAEQNIAKFLEKNMVKALEEKGFAKGSNVGLKIEIDAFEYSAKKWFFTGESTAKVRLRAVVATTEDTRFTKNFELEVNNSHFFAPSNSQDAQIINALLEEVVQDILDDQAIIRALSK